MVSQEKIYGLEELYEVRHISPPPDLKAYLQDIQVFVTHTLFPGTIPWHIMPDGSAYIIYNLIKRKEQFRSRLAIVGPRTVYKEIDRKERLLAIILRFWPGGAYPWLTFPVGELADQSFHLEHLWGEQWRQLRQEMTELAIQNAIEPCVDLLVRKLTTTLNPASGVHPLIGKSVQLLLQNEVPISIKALSSQFGVSDRYLRKLMLQQVGLGPKRLARIFRVTKAVAMADGAWPFGWSALAHSNGYYDQAHMIDEFQSLLGASPESFIQRVNRETV